MSKIIVTGGAGFIGSHITEALIESGYEVVVIDDLSTGKLENIPLDKKNLTFINGSILDIELLRREFNGATHVIHQAAIPSVPKSFDFPLETHEANSTGTLNVFIAARDAGVKRVVYASSSSVYGDSPTLPKVESMIPHPLSLYAAHKLADEIYGRLFFDLYGLETIGLRYFNVFGPRQDPNSKYAAVIPLFISNLKNGKEIVINGDGSTTRDFTFVKNVVDANIAAMNAETIEGDVVNIACGDSISLHELVTMISKYIGKEANILHGPFRTGDIQHSLADITRAKELIGFEPEVSFEAGLHKTIDSLLG